MWPAFRREEESECNSGHGEVHPSKNTAVCKRKQFELTMHVWWHCVPG